MSKIVTCIKKDLLNVKAIPVPPTYSWIIG